MGFMDDANAIRRTIKLVFDRFDDVAD